MATARYEKYAALRRFLETKAITLKKEGEMSFDMTFEEIEEVLGFPLPPSAFKHPEWWTNNNKYYRQNSLSDRSNKVWERAGFWTKNVNVDDHRVTFEYKWPLSPEEKAVREAKVKEGWTKLRQGLSQRRKDTEAKSESGMAEAARPYSKSRFHPAYGSMKGLIRVVAGTDLTKPADPEWGKVYDE
jgi:hypothetical protein